jgi:hypothetical protein
VRSLTNFLATRRNRRLRAEYARGRRDGVDRTRPFQGVPGAVRFPESEPTHLAVMEYERRLLDALPEAYAAIHRLEHNSEGDGHQGGAPSHDAQDSRIALVAELERVREWLDQFVRDAEDYVAARPTLRGQILPPSLPSTARRYESIDSFVAENRARGVSDWETREVEDAADFGYGWLWQQPDRPWAITTWRVSYNQLHEVYAVENGVKRPRPYVPFDDEPTRPRAVWLLATDFQIARVCDGDDVRTPMLFDRRSLAWEFLSELRRTLMHKRNSLVLLAEALCANRARQP